MKSVPLNRKEETSFANEQPNKMYVWSRFFQLPKHNNVVLHETVSTSALKVIEMCSYFATVTCILTSVAQTLDKKSIFQLGRAEWKAKKKLFFPVELLPVNLATP